MPTANFFSVREETLRRSATGIKNILARHNPQQWRTLYNSLDITTWSRRLERVERAQPPRHYRVLEVEPFLSPNEVPRWESDVALHTALARLTELAADYSLVLSSTDFNWRLSEILKDPNLVQSESDRAEAGLLLRQILHPISDIEEPFVFLRNLDRYYSFTSFPQLNNILTVEDDNGLLQRLGSPEARNPGRDPNRTMRRDLRKLRHFLQLIREERLAVYYCENKT